MGGRATERCEIAASSPLHRPLQDLPAAGSSNDGMTRFTEYYRSGGWRWRARTGAPIRHSNVFQKEWNDSFKFEWIEVERMTGKDYAVFDQVDAERFVVMKAAFGRQMPFEMRSGDPVGMTGEQHCGFGPEPFDRGRSNGENAPKTVVLLTLTMMPAHCWRYPGYASSTGRFVASNLFDRR
jgi:hypothetical protein